MEQLNDVQAADLLRAKYDQLRTEIAKTIVGQDDAVDKVILSIFCKGHSLLVGVPGLAKTLLVQTISKTLGLSFNRIQFTPDLMPGDILGSEILNEQRKFQFIQGPIFSNMVLADEINRTPPKTQSALLEAMQEKAVTVAGHRYALDDPFFVLATQNPIEQEGTYPLPEAQLDRFIFNILVDYPSFEEEVQIVQRTTGGAQSEPQKVLTAQEIIDIQNLVRRVPVTDHVVEYAVNLVAKTRLKGGKTAPEVEKFISWGAGPRASQYLILAAKAHALTRGKYVPDAEDVKQIAVPVLRHRLIRNFQAEAEGISTDQIIEGLL